MDRNWLNYFYPLSPEENTAQRLFCAAGSPHRLQMKENRGQFAVSNKREVHLETQGSVFKSQQFNDPQFRAGLGLVSLTVPAAIASVWGNGVLL